MRSASVSHALAVRLMPGLISCIVVMLLCTTPTRADAQVTGTWNCGSSTQCGNVMGAMTGSRQFRTSDECHAWGQINIPGGYSCSAGDGSGGNTMMSMHVPAAVALFQAAVLGGGLGAAGGSMAQHTETGESMVKEGGLAGAALWGFLSMSVNKSEWSRGSEIVVGTIVGCTGGLAAAVYKDNKAKTVASDAIEDPEQLKKTTGIGCASGFVAGAILPSLFNALPPVRWLRRTSHPVSMINHGRNVGVRIPW